MSGRVEPHAETAFRWAKEAAERQYHTEIDKDRPSDPKVKAIEAETSADGPIGDIGGANADFRKAVVGHPLAPLKEPSTLGVDSAYNTF